MPPESPVLTLDGPSGAGKGAVGQICAVRLGWHYLDSGAVYRALAHVLEKKSINIRSLDDVLKAAHEMNFECHPNPPEPARIIINGESAGAELRSEAAGEIASELAREPRIRSVLLGLQRNASRPPGLVTDGRDMGTVVFPRAVLKIFLTASPEERAHRRYNQLKLKGFDVSLAGLFQAIQERDTRDAERNASPLKAAADAVLVDSTDLTIEEVVTRVLNLLRTRLEIAGIDTVEQESGLT